MDILVSFCLKDWCGWKLFVVGKVTDAAIDDLLGLLCHLVVAVANRCLWRNRRNCYEKNRDHVSPSLFNGGQRINSVGGSKGMKSYQFLERLFCIREVLKNGFCRQRQYRYGGFICWEKHKCF